MKELQFSVVVLMTLMCSALILLMPGRVKRDKASNLSRWLMVAGLALIGAQFLVQYLTHLRDMGVTQAVLANLTFFVPASALMSLSVLTLQRQGRLTAIERWGWLTCWLVVMCGLAVAVFNDGNPLTQLSNRVRMTEMAMSVVYGAMQAYYSVMQFRELERMQAAIENYYDSERKGLTRWMKYAILVTGLMAIFVPLLIFGPNTVLIVYGLVFFWGVFMMWFSFTRYFTSNDIKRVREAEADSEETESTLSPETMQQVNQAVERWLATNDFLKAGITSPVAADAMNISRHQLTMWVKASGHSSFTRWMTSLRIEEAKRVLREHPGWTNEAVADHCGFSRAYFQKIFKQETGLPPSAFTPDITTKA